MGQERGEGRVDSCGRREKSDFGTKLENENPNPNWVRSAYRPSSLHSTHSKLHNHSGRYEHFRNTCDPKKATLRKSVSPLSSTFLKP
jgi:hypothetical protein